MVKNPTPAEKRDAEDRNAEEEPLVGPRNPEDDDAGGEPVDNLE